MITSEKLQLSSLLTDLDLLTDAYGQCMKGAQSTDVITRNQANQFC